MITLLSGCKSANDVDSDNQYFNYNQIGGLESLDPAFAKNLAIMWTTHLLYNTLVEVDSNLNVVNSLAKSYKISEDELTYTFIMHDNIFFHNNDAFPKGKGRKMTARDVVFSFNRLIDPTTASPGSWIFNDRVDSLLPFNAIDDTTFVIKLKRPFAPFLQILSMPYCSIVPYEVVEKYGIDFRSHPCGTGPFVFTKWDEGNVLLLTKNKNYWEKDEVGSKLPYLNGVKVSFHETRAMEFLLLNEGKLDFINGIDGSMKDLILTKYGTLKSNLSKTLNLHKRPYLNTEYIGILIEDNQQNPLSNKDLRKAINLGIDRKKIITYFRNGVGIPATKGFIPSLMPGMNNRNEIYKFNQSQAIELIQKVKKSNGNTLPTITLNTPEGNADVCNLIASQLSDIGLKVKVEVIQPSILRQMMSQGQTKFFKAQWIADYPDAETYLAFFYGPMPAPPNYTRFSNSTFDNLYEQAMVISDSSLRYNTYRKMDSLVSEHSPVIPLFYDEMLHFTRKNITGFSANPMNIIDLKKVRKSQ